MDVPLGGDGGKRPATKEKRIFLKDFFGKKKSYDGYRVRGGG